jgi:hypothetical protein
MSCTVDYCASDDGKSYRLDHICNSLRRIIMTTFTRKTLVAVVVYSLVAVLSLGVKLKWDWDTSSGLTVYQFVVLEENDAGIDLF